jgi:hypothetical protein
LEEMPGDGLGRGAVFRGVHFLIRGLSFHCESGDGLRGLRGCSLLIIDSQEIRMPLLLTKDETKKQGRSRAWFVVLTDATFGLGLKMGPVSLPAARRIRLRPAHRAPCSGA